MPERKAGIPPHYNHGFYWICWNWFQENKTKLIPTYDKGFTFKNKVMN
jgi:hypothetical protein